jgi:hypothetical protein
MKQKRKIIQQFEFPFSADMFRLFSDTTIDGERLSCEQEQAKRNNDLAESAQPKLFASPEKKRAAYRPTFLRVGDVIRYEGKECPVLRVNDCAAVIAVRKDAREFTTIFGAKVRIQPKPALVRISPQSEVTLVTR